MLARSGRGALVMLVGEPGIGKTALCERLANFAAASGGSPSLATATRRLVQTAVPAIC